MHPGGSSQSRVLHPSLSYFLELFCRRSVQIVGEKVGLLRGLHAGTPGDGGLERFVNQPTGYNSRCPPGHSPGIRRRRPGATLLSPPG